VTSNRLRVCWVVPAIRRFELAFRCHRHRFAYKHICATRELDETWRIGGVTGGNDGTIGRVEPICERSVSHLCFCTVGKVRVFDSLHRDTFVFENFGYSCRREVMAFEDVFRLDRSSFIDSADFVIALEECERSINHCFRSRRSPDSDRLWIGLAARPLERQERRNVSRMVIVQMTNKHIGNVCQSNARLSKSPNSAVTTIDKIRLTTGHHDARGLRPRETDTGTSASSKQN